MIVTDCCSGNEQDFVVVVVVGGCGWAVDRGSRLVIVNGQISIS